jgi:hypothetical protein
MTDPRTNYHRWRAADDDEREDDADAAFQAVFQAVVPEPPIASEFTARTMAAIAAAAARDARRARHLRIAVAGGTVAATAAGLYAGAGWAVGLGSAALLGLLDLVITLVVRTAEASQSGGGAWGVLSSLGRATSALAADTSVTIALFVISAVAIAGLVALQRLLGSDEESFP